MSLKVLIVGNVSESYHVGYMLANASRDLNLITELCDIKECNQSLNYFLGRVFFKASQKRSIEWWSFNNDIYKRLTSEKPDLVIITGIFPMQKKIFALCKDHKIKIVNFLTDNPFVSRLNSPLFLQQLSSYDLIASTKSNILDLLSDKGARNTKFFPYAFDPHWHQIPYSVSDQEKENYSCDVSFIGTGAQERLPYLNAIGSLNKYCLNVYGNDWEGIHLQGWNKFPVVLDRPFTLAMNLSKLSICLLRKSSCDISTQRTFEIAPCGGCGIYEDTKEHREILSGYPDYGFFSSPQDLADKCEWLLEHPVEREQMRQIGMEIIVKSENTFSSRLKSIIDLVNLSN